MALIHEKIAEVMTASAAIPKDRKNQSQGYSFRGVDDVYLALHDIMAKAGIFTAPEVLEDRSEDRTTKGGSALIYRILRIRFHFIASDGSEVCATVIGEGMDSGDKASNKAMSVAHKYALLQVFMIPTDEAKDPENDSHEDLAALQDPRDSKGQYSPPTDPGKPAVKGDGVSGQMLKGRVVFNNLMVEKDDAGSAIFSPADIKDMQADLSPGGRVLVSSEADLQYLRDIYTKWTQSKNDILLHRAGANDRAVEGLDFEDVK